MNATFAFGRWTNSQRKRALNLVSLGLLFLSLLILMFSPPKAETSTYKWTPQAETDGGMFIVTSGQASKILVRAPCTLESEDQILDFGDTELTFNPDAISVTVGSSEARTKHFSQLEQDIIRAGRACEISLSEYGVFLAALGEDNLSTTVPLFSDLPPIRPTELRATEPLASSGLEIYITTQPYKLEQTIPRLVALACGFLGAGLAMWAHAPRKSPTLHSSRDRREKIVVLFVAFSILLFGALFGPAYSDDGWVLESIRELSQTGTPSNLAYYSGETWYLVGHWYAYLQAYTLSVHDSLLAARILTTIILLTGLVGLQHLASRLAPDHRFARYFAYGVYILFAISWNLNLRAEAIIMVLLTFQVSVLVLSKSNSRRLFWAITLGSVGVATHQTGLVLLPGVLMALGLSFRQTRGIHAQRLLLSLLPAGLIGMVLVFSLFDLETFRSTLQAWQGLSTHSNAGLEGELNRWRKLFDVGADVPYSLTKQLLVYLYVLSLMLSGFAPQKSRSETIVLLLMVLAPASLVLTASKWIWHFGALGGLLAVWILLLILRKSKKKKGPGSSPLGRKLWRDLFLPLSAFVVPVIAVAGSAPRPQGTYSFEAFLDTPKTFSGQGCGAMNRADFFIPLEVPVENFPQKFTTNIGLVTAPIVRSSVWGIWFPSHEENEFVDSTRAGEKWRPRTDPGGWASKNTSQSNFWSLATFEESEADKGLGSGLEEKLTKELNTSHWTLVEVGLMGASDFFSISSASYGGPYEAGNYPCLRLLDGRRGLIEPFDVVVVDRSYSDYWGGIVTAELFEVGRDKMGSFSVFVVEENGWAKRITESKKVATGLPH